jgi:hypothetical protein
MGVLSHFLLSLILWLWKFLRPKVKTKWMQCYGVSQVPEGFSGSPYPGSVSPIELPVSNLWEAPGWHQPDLCSFVLTFSLLWPLVWSKVTQVPLYPGKYHPSYFLPQFKTQPLGQLAQKSLLWKIKQLFEFNLAQIFVIMFNWQNTRGQTVTCTHPATARIRSGNRRTEKLNKGKRLWT